MAETVLFVSVRNAGRTQMATAWLNALAHPGKVHAVSAGTDPAGAVYQAVIQVMKEVGLDLTSSQPRLLTPILEGSANLLITITPPVPSRALHAAGEDDEWFVEDPLGEPLDHVRKIRDDVEKMVRRLLTARHWMPLGASTPPGGN